METLDHLYMIGGNIKQYHRFEKQMAKCIIIALQVCVTKNLPTTQENISAQSLHTKVRISTVYRSQN